MILLTILLIIILTIVGMIGHSNTTAKHTIAYLIKKGKHYSVRKSDWIRLPFKLGLIGGNRLEFTFMFMGSCEYDQTKIGDEVNKLYGMTYGFDVHYRSIRLGWRHVGKGEIQILAYSYSEGKRTITYLYTVRTYNTYRALIVVGSKQETGISLFDNDGNLLSKTIVKVNSTSDWFKFRLYPFFGGIPTCPQDMIIYISEK